MEVYIGTHVEFANLLLICSRLLSQTIFLVQIETYDRGGVRQEARLKSGCGVSGLSYVVLCIAFYTFVLVVGLVGRRRLRLRIPFGASCSLVVSAACHAPFDERDAHLRKVRWGVVPERMFDGESHCSFSSGPVGLPRDGVRYR